MIWRVLYLSEHSYLPSLATVLYFSFVFVFVFVFYFVFVFRGFCISVSIHIISPPWQLCCESVHSIWTVVSCYNLAGGTGREGGALLGAESELENILH